MSSGERIQVRHARADEALLVHRITQVAFEDLRGVIFPPSGAHAETLDDVRDSIKRGGAVLALVDGEPVGCARYQPQADHVYLGRLGVLPSMRRRGVAGALLTYVEDITRELGLPEVRLGTREVLESNIRLYESHGYAIIAHYEHPKGGGMVVDMAKSVG